MRILQKTLAKEITVRVHSLSDYEMAVEASNLLFGSGTAESLRNLSNDDLMTVMEGVPFLQIEQSEIEAGINIVDLLADKTNVFPSKSEAKKMIQGGGVSVNKEKVSETSAIISTAHLLNKRYLLVQKGKKNYYLLEITQS